METNQQKDELIAQLLKQNEGFMKQVEQLTQQVTFLTKHLFGSKSEKAKYVDIPANQTSLFDETNDFFVDSPPEEEKIVIQYSRRKKKAGYREESLAKLEKETQHHYLEHPTCDCCQRNLTECGQKKMRDEVKFIPAQLIHIEHIAHSYECKCCKQEGKNHIQTAPVPKGPIPKSFVGAELLAEVAHLKYEQFTPLERQLKVWERLSLPLNSRTLANWMIHSATYLLEPIYQEMKKCLLKEPIIQADESPYRILKRSDQKSGRSKAQNWVFRTIKDIPKEIILFNSTLGRSREDLLRFIGEYNGTIVCDSYVSYKNIPGVTLANCWVHARRMWINALETNTTSEAIQMGLAYCKDLFVLESLWQDLSPEERKVQRDQLSRPLLEGLYTWIEQTLAAPGSALDKAMNYLLNQKEGLLHFLTDGRIPIHNNASENMIRPLTVGRKNWLQSTSEAGGQANAIYLSLIATAKANQLDPKSYLTYLFQVMPNSPFLEQPHLLQELMPWSEEIRKRCGIQITETAQSA